MKFKLGYTLVELMIVVSIVGILVSMGASAYGRAREKQISEAAGEQIITILQENQTSSGIGKKDCDGKFKGQEIVLTSSNKIMATSICESSRGTTSEHAISGITWSSNESFVFSPLSLGIDFGGATNMTIAYTGPNNLTYHIELTSSGTIKYLGLSP